MFNRNSQIFVEQISKRILDENEVDIYPMTSRCTLDIICGTISILSPFQAYSCIEIIYHLEAAMGIQINAQVNYDSEYINAIDR